MDKSSTSLTDSEIQKTNRISSATRYILVSTISIIVGFTICSFYQKTFNVDRKIDLSVNTSPTPPNSAQVQNSLTDSEWKNYTNDELGLSFWYPASLENVQTTTEGEVVRFEKEGIGTVVLSDKYFDLTMENLGDTTENPVCVTKDDPVKVGGQYGIQYTRSYYYGGGWCYLRYVNYLQAYTITLNLNENDYYLYFLQPWKTKEYNEDRFRDIYGYGNFIFAGILESIDTDSLTF